MSLKDGRGRSYLEIRFHDGKRVTELEEPQHVVRGVL